MVGLGGVQRLPLPQADFRIGVQGHGAVRQQDELILKVHLVPGQAGDLRPAQALQPRQPENGPLRAAGVMGQQPFHGGFVRPLKVIAHLSDLPSPAEPGVNCRRGGC